MMKLVYRVACIFFLISGVLYYSTVIMFDFKVATIMRNERISTDNVLDVFDELDYYPPLEQVFVKAYKENILPCEQLVKIGKELQHVNSRSIQALFVLAACADAQGELVKALNYTLDALKFDPNNVSLLLNLAIVQLKLEDYASSKVTLDKVRLINPNANNLAIIDRELSKYYPR